MLTICPHYTFLTIHSVGWPLRASSSPRRHRHRQTNLILKLLAHQLLTQLPQLQRLSLVLGVGRTSFVIDMTVLEVRAILICTQSVSIEPIPQTMCNPTHQQY